MYLHIFVLYNLIQSPSKTFLKAHFLPKNAKRNLFDVRSTFLCYFPNHLSAHREAPKKELPC